MAGYGHATHPLARRIPSTIHTASPQSFTCDACSVENQYISKREV